MKYELKNRGVALTCITRGEVFLYERMPFMCAGAVNEQGKVFVVNLGTGYTCELYQNTMVERLVGKFVED